MRKFRKVNEMEIDKGGLRRGHVSYFSCHSLSLSHGAFAMFILQPWTEGKHC